MMDWLGKITGWLSAIQVIIAIIKLFYNEVVVFIEKAVDAWQDVIDVLPEDSPELIDATKEEAFLNVKAETLAEFSNSPSLVPNWLISVIIELCVGRLKVSREVETDRFSKMQDKHPVSVEEIKDELPDEVRSWLFPVDN
ncbi:MAG TPA: hypothetical protein VLB82_05440 [Thermodesulfobacteriota bacterium]|nr:hypothetical protein [Thermodesulfobacteriota bacterium]